MGRYVPTYVRRDDCHIDLSPGGVRLFVSSGRMKRIVMLSGTGGRLVMSQGRSASSLCECESGCGHGGCRRPVTS